MPANTTSRRPRPPRGHGSSTTGRLFPEALDDRVTWSYSPIDPWRLAYTTGVRALDVDIDGEAVLADGRATRVDGDEIRAKAAEQAARLFARLDDL